jgi:hypothetical protein
MSIRFVSLSGRLAASPLFSFVTIGLLQLKVIWRMWDFRELTIGDTSYYFLNAVDWHRDGRAQFAWSPLYTSFMGAFLRFTGDAFAAVTAHRLVIVMALSFLVLALMRKLLPPTIAWGAAAWWVLMPIDFNALYEVHLFALVPMIVTVLFLAPRPAAWQKAAALGTLLAASLLVRNELILVTGMLAASVAITWVFERRTSKAWAPYAVCIGIALAVSAVYAWRATDCADLRGAFEHKHTFNICQTYAFGYQQRHGDFTESPWTHCQELMLRIYGVSEPSIGDAFRRHPRAMLEHFLWNIRLLPYGLQVLLFNMSAGGATPDYVDVIRGGPVVWAPTLLLLVLFAAGMRRISAERRFWMNAWLAERAWAWLALGFLSAMAAVLIVTQRPRPSYIFVLGIALRALAGMCLYALIARTSLFNRLNRMFPALALLLVVTVPPVYPLAMAGQRRTVHDQYERLAPFQTRIESSATVLAGAGLLQESCNYLVKRSNCYPRDTSVSPEDLLRIPGVNMLYLQSPDAASYLRARGWRELAGSKEAGAAWSLMSTGAH